MREEGGNLSASDNGEEQEPSLVLVVFLPRLLPLSFVPVHTFSYRLTCPRCRLHSHTCPPRPPLDCIKLHVRGQNQPRAGTLQPGNEKRLVSGVVGIV